MVKRRAMKDTSDREAGKIYSILFGALSGIISAIAFALLFGLVISASEISESGITVAAYAAAGLSALICGANTAKKYGSKGLFCGAASGVAMALLLFGCGAAVCGFENIGLTLGVPVVIVLLSSLGGVVGVNFKK